jgi:hypothetical protein
VKSLFVARRLPVWNGFCGELIRKTGNRLLMVVLVIAVGLLLYFGYNRAYFAGFFTGPHAATQGELLAAKDASAFSNSIVKVKGGATAGTGLYERTKDDSHPEGYISARYLMTEIGGKRMLVRVSPDNPLAQDAVDVAAAGAVRAEPSMTLTGRVVPLSATMSERLATSANEEPYLPFLLDTYDYKSFGWVSVVIGGLCLLGAVWGGWVYLQRSNNPAQDPFARALAKYGQLESVVPQVDAEMASAHTTISKGANSVHIGQHWMVATQPFRAFGSRLDGLVWVYRLVVKRKMYFVIPAGSRHTLIAYDRFGQKIAVQLDELKTGEAMQFLRNVAPQAIFGYDKRLVKLWKAGNKAADRIGFITEAQAVLAGQTLPDTVTRKQYAG